MTSILEYLQNATARLKGAHSPSPRLDSEILLAYSLGVDRTWLVAHGNDSLPYDIIASTDTLVKRRQDHEPIAYLIGSKEFYGRTFIVTPDVLVPRPETETIIDIAKHLPLPASAQIIDVGCGSGCIGLTLGLELSGVQSITLSDISDGALMIAQQNAQALAVDVLIKKSDLLASFTDRGPHFSLVVANLPYVDKSWQRSPETDHEPALALFADDGGLSLIRQLLVQASTILAPNGYLLLEADPCQHDNIITISRKNSFTLVESRDYAICLSKD